MTFAGISWIDLSWTSIGQARLGLGFARLDSFELGLALLNTAELNPLIWAGLRWFRLSYNWLELTRLDQLKLALLGWPHLVFAGLGWFSAGVGSAR